ncbi:MAG: acyltransferase [Gammaproteobacteria bacterium]|nr:acyltransferase [Gammaproteobacteria bacterium]
MLLNLQALRGIAALLVLMHHSLAHFKAMGLSNPVFEFVATHGNTGVDVFFVISGYVMAKTTSNSEHGFGTSFSFLGKRFARIYLGYWPIFLLALIIYYYHRPDYLLDKQMFQSFLLLIPSNYSALVITPAWSLTYELYFYLVVGLILSTNMLKPVPTFLMISFLIILKSIFTKPGDNYLMDFFFSPYVFEFVLGYLIFNYWPYLSAKRWVPVSVVLGTVFLSIAVQLDANYGYLRFTAFGIYSVCLVWLMVLLEAHDLFIFRGLIKKIGDSSYTLYLSHTVLLGLFYSFRIRDYLVSKDFALTGFIACLVVIITISWMFYVLIEAPLYKGAKKRIRNRFDTNS